MHRFQNIICTILTLLSFAIVQAATYEPDVDFTPNEQWRWHEQELLRGHILYHGVEADDGTLVFSTPESLLLYDGYTLDEVPYPENQTEFVPYQLFYSKNGYVYINASTGIFGYRDGEWKQFIEHTYSSAEIVNVFVRNPSGLELAVLYHGTYEIKGDELVRMEGVPGGFSSAAFDGLNRLWCNAPNGKVFRYQFEKNELKRPIEVKEIRLGYQHVTHPWIVASPKSEEIWITNWRLGLPAQRWNEKNESWTPVDLSHLSGNNGHTSAFRINETDMIIFTKTEVLFQKEDDWHSIGYPKFDFPTNQPFFVSRKNGNLILGGRGEKTYEVEYSTSQQDSYHGLHFQCDVGGKTRWFISTEGYVVEQDTIYDTWERHEENVIDTPVTVFKSRNDTVWAAGSHQGEAAVSYYDGRGWKLDSFPQLNGMISHLSARELPNGDIVFGSGDDSSPTTGGGLVRYVNGSTRDRPEYIAPPRVPRRIVGFAADADAQLWAGGIKLSRTPLDFGSDYKIWEDLQDEVWIDHLIEDDQSNIWVGLWNRGLYQISGDEWNLFRNDDQLASSQVSYLLKDEHREGNIWIATDRGISRFDGEVWYPQALPQDLRFYRESGTLRQSSDGAIWVNQAARGWYFRRKSNFYLTKSIHDNFRTVRYQPDSNPPMVEILTDVAKSTAPANIIIEWKGVDKWSHTPNSKLKYSYRLNEDEWSPFEEAESKGFLDLPSGDFDFEVRAIDLDGNISPATAKASFVVIPPIWQRAWFIAAVFFAVGTIILLAVLLFRQRIRHIMQLEEFKLQFFTNISHELRTPLTVILGPLESQLSKLPIGWDKKPLELAYRNAQKTLGLIDQILDFRSAETGNIKIELARSDLVETAKEVVHLIRPLSEARSQVLDFSCDVDSCVVWYDAEKIEKILNNLISNAIKYTQRNGKISVAIKIHDFEESVNVEFVVEDNGAGIPIGKIDDIFEVFYRVGTTKNKKVRGSGIGLAYTKNLVEACEGAISVDSPITNVNGQQQGTRFTVTLPLYKQMEGRPEIEDTEPLQKELETDSESAASIESDSQDKPQILIAEDDDQIRDFLASELSEAWAVTSAEDGAKALDLAQERIPDLIVTDVMMPELDGKELCRRIKSEDRTSHIPVIMLTALKSEMHELEGLELGADDYLSKPIRLSILKRRIQNILESRRKLHARFSEQKQEAKVVTREITTNTIDEAFLNKAVSMIEQNVEDPLFDVEEFATRMHMSRMTLYRKFKAITGDSPSSFIRSIRMNKAAALLSTGEHTVSEVADRVGISDLSSFSTSFKKHFKVSPSQYAGRNK
ncbi:hybrid sensor histidine kinase/response regulator transcription factor [Pelagicoccus mobilis]|uniref:histidine kinase n=1 Tax=Pelagicoccus mobilis TaxID=415221 RepID=A0A934VPS3_9BACT|nr:response regulator [Pelagicoccus mobilis]MBK1875828.1 response regulator [Pelagicoccus mobilis]